MAHFYEVAIGKNSVTIPNLLSENGRIAWATMKACLSDTKDKQLCELMTIVDSGLDNQFRNFDDSDGVVLPRQIERALAYLASTVIEQEKVENIIALSTRKR